MSTRIAHRSIGKSRKYRNRGTIARTAGLLCFSFSALSTSAAAGRIADDSFDGTANVRSGNGNHSTATGAVRTFDRFDHSLIFDHAHGGQTNDNPYIRFFDRATDTGDDGKVRKGVRNHAVVNFASKIELHPNDNPVSSEIGRSPTIRYGAAFHLWHHDAGRVRWFQSTVDDKMFHGRVPQAGKVGSPFTAGQPVPEPSSFALLLAGAGAAGFAHRRRRHAQLES